MKKSLCFFTSVFPYGESETFIGNEITTTAPYFETVYLFHKSKSSSKRPVPSNVKLIYIDPPSANDTKKCLLKNLRLFICLSFTEFLFSRQKKLFLKRLKYNLHYIVHCIFYADKIAATLEPDTLKNACFYSYWFYDWNCSLAILKYRKRIFKNSTRAHGFDVYENNGKPNYLPLRKFCLRNTDKVYTVSKTGELYLKQLYPKYQNKIIRSYLGTRDGGLNPAPVSGSPIHIISCAHTNAVKRVHLIAEALSKVTCPVTWTHIGDGLLQNALIEQVAQLPPSITVNIKGRQSQQDIFLFYSQTPIHLFINCSISEGLPVSVVEALSFGIPVVATDVGGTGEIVNDTTGKLLPVDFKPDQLADLICGSANNSFDRKKIKRFWMENFDADTNYREFVKQLVL